MTFVLGLNLPYCWLYRLHYFSELYMIDSQFILMNTFMKSHKYGKSESIFRKHYGLCYGNLQFMNYI